MGSRSDLFSCKVLAYFLNVTLLMRRKKEDYERRHVLLTLVFWFLP